MKIRTGFVSNSSASSFCIFGVHLDEDEILEILRKKFPEEDEDELRDHLWNDDLFGDLDVNSPEGDGVYIGRSWTEVGDNETGKQFKERVEQDLKNVLPDIKLELSTHEEAYNNG